MDAEEPSGARQTATGSPKGERGGANQYKAENVFWVPADARWSHLQASAKQPTIGKLVDDAMVAIERDNPRLKGVLPKDYALANPPFNDSDWFRKDDGVRWQLAGQYALKHATIKKELEESRAALETAEKTYKDLLAARDTSVKAARDKIEGLKRDIGDMKMQSAVAELNEMAAGMVSEIGGSGDTLGRLSEMVKEEKDKASGRARVARDAIDMTEIHAKAGEQKALADLALADFAAAEGIALEGATDASGSAGGDTTQKTMGPSETN